MFSKEITKQVIDMRSKGMSFNEINRATGVSKSTLSLWLRKLLLSEPAKARLRGLRIDGNKKAGIVLSERRMVREAKATKEAQDTLAAIPVASKQQKKLMCALVYYCEGSKSIKHGMTFTNSDPELMRTFLSLLRGGFSLDEARFRAHLHLHGYHIEKIQKTFWSNIMNIPEKNFIKSFMKKESGINIKEGYPGCVTIRYHDAALGRELLEIARQFFRKVR